MERLASAKRSANIGSTSSRSRIRKALYDASPWIDCCTHRHKTTSLLVWAVAQLRRLGCPVG
jgi:ribulose-5-phosphate 4-epimerase/fuculose-1-phosphate aldolase